MQGLSSFKTDSVQATENTKSAGMFKTQWIYSVLQLVQIKTAISANMANTSSLLQTLLSTVFLEKAFSRCELYLVSGCGIIRFF